MNLEYNTNESPIPDIVNGITPIEEVKNNVEEFLNDIKNNSIVKLKEFSDKLEKYKSEIDPNTENGLKALSKLEEIGKEQRIIEKEYVNDLILWHGSGYSGITIENLSVDRLSGEAGKFAELRYKSSASSDPEYFGFYTTNSIDYAKKYTGTNNMMLQDLEKDFEKECEENKIFEIKDQADSLYYYMFTKKLTYKKAIELFRQEREEQINPIFEKKEYSLEELGQISINNDYNRLLSKKIEESNLKSTLYKLNVNKDAKIGDIKEIFGPNCNKKIQKLTKEDFEIARGLGYDVIVDNVNHQDKEYAILNKNVIKNIDKSLQKEIKETDEKTRKQKIQYVYPGFE